MKQKLELTEIEVKELIKNTRDLPTCERPVFLYMKRHNVTGLLYFGRTLQEPYRYVGSGISWRKHLKENGRNVSTIWLRKFENENDPRLEKMARKISNELNVVESERFANNCIEKGHNKPNPLPSYEFLHECFNYNKETGEIFWKIRPCYHFGGNESIMRFWNKRYAETKIDNINLDGYNKVTINHVLYLVHRIVWKMVTGQDPKEIIDHKNKIRHDNKFNNLREATRRENNINSKDIYNKTGVKGVCKRGIRYYAYITHQGKQMYLGSFATLDEARIAYEAESLKIHGEFSTISKDLHAENVKNTKITPSKQKYPRGVSYDKRYGIFQSFIMFGSVKVNLGSFNNPKEASEMYLKALAIRNESSSASIGEFRQKINNIKKVLEYKGYNYSEKYNRYLARITYKRKIYHLGYYNEPNHAGEIYRQASCLLSEYLNSLDDKLDANVDYIRKMFSDLRESQKHS